MVSWARWWNTQIKVNTTQVHEQMGHPVSIMYYIIFPEVKLWPIRSIDEYYRNGMVLLRYMRHLSSPELHIAVAGSKLSCCLLVRP